MVRGLGTAVMHGTTLAMLAAITHELPERETREAAAEYDFNPLWFVPGFLAAVAIHTLFNQFPNQPMLAMLGTLVACADHLMASSGSDRSRHRSGSISSAKHTARIWRPSGAANSLTTNPGGASPRSRGGWADPTAEHIREYCEVLTCLIIEAEDALSRQATETEREEIDLATDSRARCLKQTRLAEAPSRR